MVPQVWGCVDGNWVMVAPVVLQFVLVPPRYKYEVPISNLKIWVLKSHDHREFKLFRAQGWAFIASIQHTLQRNNSHTFTPHQ